MALIYLFALLSDFLKTSFVQENFPSCLLERGLMGDRRAPELISWLVQAPLRGDAAKRQTTMPECILPTGKYIFLRPRGGLEVIGKMVQLADQNDFGNLSQGREWNMR